MTSNLSAFPFIQERAEARPSLWNDVYSQISANIAAVDSSVSGFSGDTLVASSGTFSLTSNLSIGRDLWVKGNVLVGQPASVVTRTALTLGVRSDTSDYIHFADTSGAKSSYILGSHVGGTADGLNLWDQSGSTMIVSFSKQSVRFYQKVVGQTFDAGGAVYNVKTYGAVGDGVADDTASIALTIATCAAAGGGVVFFPGSEGPGQRYRITSTLTISDDNIRLQGVGYSMTAITPPATFIHGPAVNGPLIATLGNRRGFSIIDVGLEGGGATTPASVGISMTSGYEPYFQRVFLDSFGGSAITLGANVIGVTLSDLFAQNCLMGLPTAPTGVYDLRATDVRAFGCFSTTGKFGMGSIGNGNQYGWAIRQGPGMYYGSMGDQAHHGWFVPGLENVFMGCRAYQNQGSGFSVTGGPGNRFIGCLVLAGGQDADNTYDGFFVTGFGNLFSACFVDGQSTDTVLMRSGFNDANGTAGVDTNVFVNRYMDNAIGSAMRAGTYRTTSNAYRIGQGHRVYSGVGDASKTVSNLSDAETIIYDTPLSANRTLTISGSGSADAIKGSQMRVVRRSTATGSGTLAVVATGTETQMLTPGQWVDFEVDGGQLWRKTAFGLTPGGAGTALDPPFTYSSELSLGWYRSAASTMALSYGTLLVNGPVWGSGLSIGGTGTLIPAISSTSSLVAPFVVQGSASSFTRIIWAAAQPGDHILVTPGPTATVSSISSGLVAHSHCTQAGQVEFRLSNVSTLVQNQSTRTWYFTRISAF